MIMHLKTTAPPAPSKFVPDIPTEIDELVAWALKKKPEERPNGAAEMRQVVQALKRVYPVERTEASLPPRGVTGRATPHKPQLHRAGADDGVETTVLTSKAPPTRRRASRARARAAVPRLSPRRVPAQARPRRPSRRCRIRCAVDAGGPRGDDGGPEVLGGHRRHGSGHRRRRARLRRHLAGRHRRRARRKCLLGARQDRHRHPGVRRPSALDTHMLPPEVKTVLDRPGAPRGTAVVASRTTDSIQDLVDAAQAAGANTRRPRTTPGPSAAARGCCSRSRSRRWW